ncbi:hypothetical protein, conserved [Babesia bigemina]|uniref:C3H1-type domain-containing protein n=1 Tax=Babesia bigemina TaxID=5866 RepID=A0A061BU53_BABBI|nr:hypothetical protein, conserved [Babesia bigemina]CDR71989.1 hypothetical protein, conserved [Babesia bigemina]|eukprot:XP_012770930.1 hypothetical protein, conserved [Babesia bigemina]
MTSGALASDKISDLAPTRFTKYRAQVDQDSLTSVDPKQLQGELPSKIKEIQTQVVTVSLASIDKLNTEAGQQLELVTSTLSQLCGAVQRALKDVNFFLNNFKEGQIGEKLEAIKEKINKLQSIDLQKVIRLTDAFEGFSADECAKTIAELDKHVAEQVTQATEKLTTQAKKHYVSTLKTELQNFTVRVQGHLTGLTPLIDKDLTIGYKGLMKTVQGVKFIVEHKKDAEFDTSSDTTLLTKLNDAVTLPPRQEKPTKEHFKELSSAFKHYFNNIHGYVKEEISRLDKQYKHTLNYQLTHTESKYLEKLYTSKLDAANTALNNLLDHISNHRYNHEVPAMLDQLSAAIATLAPESFARTTTPLLDGIGKGVEGFVSELEKAYTSVYDSETFGGEMFEKDKLTPYGAKFAKICLTVVCTLKATLTDLTHNCKSLRGQQINKSTDVGRSFVAHGYAVSDATLQNGELQNKPTVAGENVAKRLMLQISGADDNQHLRWCESNKQRKADHFHVFDAIDCIFSHFEQYNELCHLLTVSAKQHPCSVYDILIWLSGFPYTAVYSAMRDITISDLFDNPHKKAAGDDELELTSTDMAAQSITAHPRNISYTYVRKAVDHICATSYDVLTAVVGTGDSRSVYASDFCNNSFNFHYPSDPSDCLDMLLDLLRRLLPVLRFLELQCNITPEHHGWSHCRYGRDIPTTKSRCNEHSSEEPNGQAKCQVNCQPTSPLMLYLSDSLPGHLPHQLQSVGCRAKCSTCSKSAPGQPCLLPLGFKGFSGSTKTGRQLRDAIKTFIGTGLISSLMCLLPKPPSTLPEHFQFVFTLVGAFSANRDVNSNAVNAAFVKAIKKQSIELYAEPATLIGALSDAYKNGQGHEGRNHPKPTEADLSSLSKTESCKYASTDDVHCAPYLTTLYSDAYHYAAEKHAGLYLSWAVYLPWSFWQCLESLFRAFTNISCQDWGCRRCTHGTACKRGKHGAAYNCQCKGIVECRGVVSTLYSFGFTFGNPEKLLDAEGRRYCHNFHRQLHNVLNSNSFRKLFEKCDEFIFTIRQPFIWMTVALWSLSLFYLICVMVGRLDVLHIKSHLRVPSSHKITAQSLLAASQVGRLAKISYLQP